jgi:hypothetical protein
MHPDAPRRRVSASFYAAAFFILTIGLLGAAAAAELKANLPQPAQTEMSSPAPFPEWQD